MQAKQLKCMNITEYSLSLLAYIFVVSYAAVLVNKYN